MPVKQNARMRQKIIFIAGKDPREERGGHSSYVRAHARAALRLGFEPHLFCAGHRTNTTRTDYAPGDAEALAQTLARALTNPHLRLALARRARETFARRFAPEALVHALGETYAGLGFAA
jgi:hypothetical protein